MFSSCLYRFKGLTYRFFLTMAKVGIFFETTKEFAKKVLLKKL